MDDLEKLLKRANENDRRRILSVLTQLRAGKVEGLRYQKLKGSDVHRIRVGRYRILFSFTKTQGIRIEDVKLRNEKTYT